MSTLNSFLYKIIFCSADNWNKSSKRPGRLTYSSFTGAHMNEIHRTEWIGYAQKPIADLMKFLQDKILQALEIQLIVIGFCKGGG